MIRIRPIRCVITYALVLGLSAMGVCAPVLAAQSTAGADQATAAPKPGSAAKQTCCCGTPDGRCCGKGCCLKPNPKPAPPETPASPSSQNEHELLMLGLAARLEVVAIDCQRRFAGETSLLDGLPSVATLQSQHVRIQT